MAIVFALILPLWFLSAQLELMLVPQSAQVGWQSLLFFIIGPLVVLATALGIVISVLTLRRNRTRGRILAVIALVLALLDTCYITYVLVIAPIIASAQT